MQNRLLRLVGFGPLAHRPPLSGRFWLYCAAAYLMPVMTQVVLPDDPGLYDELVWLVTLAPAFLLSLHYGLRGAVAGLLMGTTLFITVQIVVALNFTPDDWRVTVPIYISYGVLAISVGWLSEQLHGYYQQALRNARLAAIGEFAVTIRHEVNNALTSIVAESQLLGETEAGLSVEGRAAARSIHHAALRIARDVRKLTSLANAPVTEYAAGIQMIDLKAAASLEDLIIPRVRG
jgi:signal transduction histidine kinase